MTLYCLEFIFWSYNFILCFGQLQSHAVLVTGITFSAGLRRTPATGCPSPAKPPRPSSRSSSPQDPKLKHISFQVRLDNRVLTSGSVTRFYGPMKVLKVKLCIINGIFLKSVWWFRCSWIVFIILGVLQALKVKIQWFRPLIRKGQF